MSMQPDHRFDWKQCYFCGGAEIGGPAAGHHRECPYRWHGPGEPTVVIRLNAYQAGNLLWALKQGWNSKIPQLNNGDWVGEIPQQLEAKMRAAGSQWPQFLDPPCNAGEKPMQTPPLTDSPPSAP